MSNLLNHAKEEFRIAGWCDADGNYSDPMQKAICENILAMIKIFSDEGHSGSSAAYTVSCLERLLRFETLSPLTGEDSEWVDVSGPSCGEPMWQNIRDSRVFKRANGQAYFIEGKIFRRASGSCYTSSDSFVDIEFPCSPKSEYVDVED